MASGPSATTAVALPQPGSLTWGFGLKALGCCRCPEPQLYLLPGEVPRLFVHRYAAQPAETQDGGGMRQVQLHAPSTCQELDEPLGSWAVPAMLH